MKQIYLYTINGLVDAVAIPLEHTVQIRAKEGNLSIIVPMGVYERKMEEDKPTFYTC